MKRIGKSLDLAAQAFLTLAMVILLGGFVAVGASVVFGQAAWFTSGLAAVGAGSMLGLVTASWINRDV
jgi:dipeptide/tripeptide permease